jgi:hypothetical protein
MGLKMPRKKSSKRLRRQGALPGLPTNPALERIRQLRKSKAAKRRAAINKLSSLDEEHMTSTDEPKTDKRGSIRPFQSDELQSVAIDIAQLEALADSDLNHIAEQVDSPIAMYAREVLGRRIDLRRKVQRAEPRRMSIESLEAIVSGVDTTRPIDLAKQVLMQKRADRRRAEKQERKLIEKAKARQAALNSGAVNPKSPDWWREQT